LLDGEVRLKIKYCIVSLIIFFAIFLVSSTCMADPAVIIYDYEISPSVFIPGDNGTLTLTIKNAESANTVARTTTSGSTSTVYTDTVGVILSNIWIDHASDSNNKKVKAILNYEDTGVLAPGTSFDITFKIIAEEGIKEGLYFPVVGIDVETYTDVSFPIPVKVSNTTIDLISSNIPSEIPMSGSTDVTLSVINNREGSVDGVTVIAEEIDDITFIPESVFIGTLDSDSSEDATFSIVPEKVGTYNLSFKVRYKNGDNFHENTLLAAIEVTENYDVAPVLYSFPSYISKGQTDVARLEVYNAKTESISGVIVTPISDVAISPSKYFIGSMDPDDVFSASFTIYSSNLEIGENYTVDFKVSFKQDDNYYETDSVGSSFMVVRPTVQQGTDLSVYIVILFAAIIVIYLLIRFLKKRRIIR